MGIYCVGLAVCQGVVGVRSGWLIASVRNGQVMHVAALREAETRRSVESAASVDNPRRRASIPFDLRGAGCPPSLGQPAPLSLDPVKASGRGLPPLPTDPT